MLLVFSILTVKRAFGLPRFLESLGMNNHFVDLVGRPQHFVVISVFLKKLNLYFSNQLKQDGRYYFLILHKHQTCLLAPLLSYPAVIPVTFVFKGFLIRPIKLLNQLMLIDMTLNLLRIQLYGCIQHYRQQIVQQVLHSPTMRLAKIFTVITT